MNLKTAIIGGGAAGFFLAIRLKTLVPEMDVTILERHERVLRKVEVSGGGRCNCTNSFARITNLAQAYPRGHRVMKRLFREFNHESAYEWFESHGVPLVTQEDECVFPKAQDSHAIINLFLAECHRLGVRIHTEADGFAEAIKDGELLYDFVAVTTGGMTPAVRQLFEEKDIIPPLPSLFTFTIEDKKLRSLMGTVVEAVASIPGTKLRSEGPLLITHWGMSGPAIIKLSSYAARLLAERNYRMPLAINWCATAGVEDVREWVEHTRKAEGQKLVVNVRPYDFSTRFWEYLTARAGIESTQRRWSEIGPKQTNRLIEVLTNDQYGIAGRSAYKDEFVTCGGISLDAVHPDTLEHKRIPGLYFAGEVLDIDGITGGFNLQAAWTTADAVARAIHNKCKE